MNKVSKYLLLLMLAILFILNPSGQIANAIGVYEPDIPMGKWVGTGKSELFKITGSDESQFVYTENWKVEVDGAMKGEMMLMRPKTNNAMGLTFAHPSVVSQWGQAFNGNPSYVQQSSPATIQNLYYPGAYQRVYSRLIAERSGAMVSLRGSGQRTQWGHEIGIVVVKTTPWPSPQISGPSTVSKGQTVTYTISGTEYNPYAEWIQWKFLNGSTSLDSGSQYSDSFSKTVNVTFNSCGSNTLRLYAKDKVEREKSISKTVNVTGCDNGGTNPPPTDPEEPPFEKPPEPNPPESCSVPSIIGGNPRDEYKIDLRVNRIEGKTVEKGKQTETPVEVERVKKIEEDHVNDWQSRIQADIKRVKNEISTLQQQRSALQSALSSAQSEYAACDSESDCGAIASRISALKTQLAKVNCDIRYKEAELAGYNKELEDLAKEITKNQTITALVKLTFHGDGATVGSQNVDLKRGDIKKLLYLWNLPSDGKVRAEINPYRVHKEFTYSNNVRETPIYIATFEKTACAKPGQSAKASGVVRTITYTDEEGNSHTTILREYVEGKIINQSRNSMRAGYGFKYDVETVYRNEDPQSDAYGIKKTESYFPSLVNFLPYNKGSEGYISPMDLMRNDSSGPPRNEKKIWSLPNVWVEEYSGNVFDLNWASNPLHDPSEKMLNGGRKWYVPFEQKDGSYPFKVRGFEAGVNKMDICMTGLVEIEGSFVGDPNGNDDFIRRTVSPNNPFPAGVGWNWKGKEGVITGLQSWWNNPPNRDPKSVPSNFHDSVIIDQKKLKQIKEYNQKHGMKFYLDSDFKEEVGY